MTEYQVRYFYTNDPNIDEQMITNLRTKATGRVLHIFLSVGNRLKKEEKKIQYQTVPEGMETKCKNYHVLTTNRKNTMGVNLHLKEIRMPTERHFINHM